MKKKIFFLIHSLITSGAEKFLVSLVNNLDYSEFDCTLISYSKDNPLAVGLNKEVKLIVLARDSKFDIKPLIKTRKLIANLKPDSLFCVNFFTFFFMNISTLFSSNKARRIISYHSTIHKDKRDHIGMVFYSKWIRKGDKIIAVCNNQINHTVEQYKINRSFFTAIYNGVDTDYWRLPATVDEPNLIRKQYGIPLDAKIIIKTAAFRLEKNHKAAVDAFNLLNENGMKNIFLLFVGDGFFRSEVEDYVKTLNLTHRVIFTGNQKDVRPYYWASDIFTLTSNGVETFSIAALEALSCGLPCVLTEIGGANEMIENGVNGFLSETNYESIADNWNKVLSGSFNKVKIASIIKSRFSLKQMAENYGRILK